MTVTMKTIRNGSSAIETSLAIRSAGVCWALFDQIGGNVVKGSYNVASISDDAAGEFTVNFTNSRTEAGYNIFGAPIANDCNFKGGGTPTTSSEEGLTWDVSTISFGDKDNALFVRGDLA